MKKESNDRDTLAREKRRTRLLRGLKLKESVGVEIGPLCWPLVRRADAPNIIYVDHTDTPHLREKYRDDPRVDPDQIVNVDAEGGGTLFERMSNIARGAPKAQIGEEEEDYRPEPIEIPRFLNRQNNQ